MVGLMVALYIREGRWGGGVWGGNVGKYGCERVSFVYSLIWWP